MSFFKNEKKADCIALLLLIVITSFIYSYLFTIPQLSLVGDAQRYNGYQAYIIKYSLEHFGQLGLWDQFLSSGMSWISHPGGAQFSPSAWIITFLFHDIYFGSRMLFFVHTLSASVSLYILFRILGLRKVTSFFVAIVGVCNQYITLFVANGWFEELFGFTLLPLTVGLLWHAIIKKKHKYAVFAAFLMSLHFFMNSYYVFHYNVIVMLWIMLILGIDQVYKYRRDKNILMKQALSFSIIIILFWIVFIGIASVKLFPLLEFRSISARNIVPLNVVESPGNIMTFTFFYSYLRDVFIPAGHTNEFTRWGNNIGLVLFFLSVMYFLFKRTLHYGAFVGLFILGVWGYFANKIPIDLYAFFYHVLPGFDSNMYPYRFTIIMYFAFLVCVALGLDFLIRQKNKFITAIGYGMGFVLIMSVVWFNSPFKSTHSYPQTVPITRELLKKSVTIEKNKDVQKPPIIKYIHSESLETTLARILRAYRPEGRVYSNSPNMTNDVLLLGGIPSVQHSYNPIIPTYQYSAIIPVKASDSLELVKNRFKILSVLNVRFQLQTKIKFEYEGCKKLGVASFSAATNVACDFLESRLTPLVLQKDGGIYHDRDVLPKFTVISHPILLISDNRFHDYSGFIAKKIMFHTDFDEHLVTVLSGGSSYIDDYNLNTLKQFKAIFLVDPKIKNKEKVDSLLSAYEKNGGKVLKLSSKWISYQSLHQRSGSLWSNNPAWNYSEKNSKEISNILSSLESLNGNSIVIEKYTPEDLVFNTKTVSDNQVLQFSDSFYPGWKAMLDGKKIPVYMADGLVKGVIIPTKGTHSVRFYYSPDSLRVGSLITGITLTIVLGLGIVCLKTKMFVT